MNAFLTNVRQTLAPARDSKDGLLPPLLVACFALGALAAGRLARSLSSRRELLLGVTAGAQALLLLGATGAKVALAAIARSRVPLTPDAAV